MQIASIGIDLGPQAPREGFTEITSGRSREQQELVSNLQRLLERGLGRRREERVGSTNESVRAMTGE